jgi:aryl-alcohol dehydrogenase-like predicted oxidoreductase
VSQLTYGTMQLRANADGRSASDLLCHLHDLGVDTHHSSHEYDTHPLYLDALTEARTTGRTFHHLVKLSAPSFDNNRFDSAALHSLVDAELAALGTERLASVQWLARTPDASDLAGRLQLLRDQNDEILGCFDELVASGKVANVSSFPYHPDFASAAIASTTATTLCTYLNLAELEYVELLDRATSFIAIRPLAAGTLLADPADRPEPGTEPPGAPAGRATLARRCPDPARRAGVATTFPLLSPRVATVVVSMNSAHHIESLVEAAGSVTPDADAFASWVHDVRHTTEAAAGV